MAVEFSWPGGRQLSWAADSEPIVPCQVHPTPPLMIRRSLVLAVTLGIAAGPAAGAVSTYPDGQGNTITIDVRAPGGQPAKYAKILADTIHGDEINDVTVRVVSRAAIARECHPLALACYGAEPRQRPLIFVPAISATRLRSTLVHEYGHHVDQAYAHRVTSSGRLDGTPRWWNARRIGARLGKRQVAWNYRRGWDRSLAEIFAEDYAVTNLGRRAEFDIFWLDRPSARARAALRKDLEDPIGLTRRHVGVAWLRPGAERVVPFRVNRTRRVAISTAARNPRGPRRVVTTLRCDDRDIGRSVATRRRQAAIRGAVIPGGSRCEVVYSADGAPALLESFITLR